MTSNIISEIDKFKGKMSDSNLTDHINKTFSTSFTISQIKYQVERLMNINFGVPDIDAYSFSEMAEKASKENGAFFAIKLHNNNQFQRALYLSPDMLEYANYFLDIVIVDATYKRNRFLIMFDFSIIRNF